MSCSVIESGQQIVRAERGRAVRFDNPANENVEVIRYDGCLVMNVSAVDYLFNFECDTTVFVELKGRDIGRASQQLRDSLVRCSAAGMCQGRKIALIVCSKVPLGATAVRNLQESMRRAGFNGTKVKGRVWQGTVDSLK